MWFSNRNSSQQRGSESEDAAAPATPAVGGNSRDSSGDQNKEGAQGGNQDARRSVVRYAKPVPKLQQKLEITTDDGDDSPSSKMWQVYAMAAFMIGRWVWAKVKERRARTAKRDDED